MFRAIKNPRTPGNVVLAAVIGLCDDGGKE